MMSLLAPLRESAKWIVQSSREPVSIVPAFYGANSSLVGAAAICLSNLGSQVQRSASTLRFDRPGVRNVEAVHGN